MLLQGHFFFLNLGKTWFLADYLKTKRTCEKTNICLFKRWHFERTLELEMYFDILTHQTVVGLMQRSWFCSVGFGKQGQVVQTRQGRRHWRTQIQIVNMLLFFRQILSNINIKWSKYRSEDTIPWTARVLLQMCWLVDASVVLEPNRGVLWYAPLTTWWVLIYQSRFSDLSRTDGMSTVKLRRVCSWCPTGHPLTQHVAIFKHILSRTKMWTGVSYCPKAFPPTIYDTLRFVFDGIF